MVKLPYIQELEDQMNVFVRRGAREHNDALAQALCEWIMSQSTAYLVSGPSGAAPKKMRAAMLDVLDCPMDKVESALKSHGIRLVDIPSGMDGARTDASNEKDQIWKPPSSPGDIAVSAGIPSRAPGWYAPLLGRVVAAARRTEFPPRRKAAFSDTATQTLSFAFEVSEEGFQLIGAAGELFVSANAEFWSSFRPH